MAPQKISKNPFYFRKCSGIFTHAKKEFIFYIMASPKGKFPGFAPAQKRVAHLVYSSDLSSGQFVHIS